MKKMLYIANVRMPTERAHGIQIVKTCEALAKAGTSVELVVPARGTKITETPEKYYTLQTIFPIKRLPVLDIVEWGTVGFIIESISFAVAALRHVHRKPGIVYGRDEWILAFLMLCGIENIVWESHTGAWNTAARYLARNTHVIVISNGLKNFYVERGISPERISVVHDGVDIFAFEHTETKSVARNRLMIPGDTKVALYIGALGSWKGTDTLFQASELLPKGISIAVITNSDVTAVQQKYPRVLFLGEEPYKNLPHNQKAADVLVLPTSTRDRIGALFTSPLKLFTYMASGVPIVASKVPSTLEVLPEKAAYWFTADDAHSLARAIEEAVRDPRAPETTRVAKEVVTRYTWDTRALAILAHV